MSDWQPIETCPEGECVLLYWPHGEKGNGGMECAVVYWDKDDPSGMGMSLWTHGGPNSGSDWEPRNRELPTHWQPLPPPPPSAAADER